MITFEEKVMNIAKDLVTLYKDIDYYDVIDATQDIDNIEGEFIDAAYQNLVNKDARLDITLQLEEFKMDIDDPNIKLNITNMLDRIESLFQNTRLVNLTNKFESIKNTGLYNNSQLHEIEKGIQNGVDVRYYLSENFNANQMYQIRMLLEFKKHTPRDIEISILSNPNLSYGQMGELRRSFEAGLTNEQVQIIANHNFNRLQMSQIRRMFEDGNSSLEDVKNIAFPLYKFEQLWVIREIYEKIEDKSLLPDKLFDWDISLKELIDLKEETLRFQNNEIPKSEKIIDKAVENEKKGIIAAISEITKNKDTISSSNLEHNNQKQHFYER